MTRTLSCRLLMAGLTLALPLAALADKPGFCPPVQVGLRGAPPPQAPGFLSLPPPLWGQPLSEAQQDQAFAILHDAAPALYEQGKRLQQSDEGLRRMAESGALDEARLAGLAVANARARTELLVLHAHVMQRILALLTSEQRAQYNANHAACEPR